jgi:4-amino-4-deoxy-L-arabinose transferase-like glycosyltransferase
MKLLRTHAVAIFLGICAFVLIFWGVGDGHLNNWDEAWYAAVSRQMARTGDFITPVWNTKPFFEKPPMYYWISAVAYKVLGETTLSARFFSALGTATSVILVYILGFLLFDRLTGILSMITLISTVGFLYRGRTGNMDGFLTAPLLLSMGAFVCLIKTKRKKLWFGIATISILVAALTKGAIAFVFPILGCLLGSCRGFSPKNTHKGTPFWGPLRLRHPCVIANISGYAFATGIAFFIFILWFLSYRCMFGSQFVSQFFSQQTEKIAPSASVTSGFSFEYLIYLKSGLRLWFLLFIPSFILSWGVWRKNKAFLFLLYVTLFFVFLSFSANKSDWYLMTFYPVYALIIGSVAVWAWQKYVKKISPVVLIVGFIALAGYQLVIYRTLYMPPDVAEGEAKVALAARDIVPKNLPIYLTHYYFPTTIYYSEHLVYAVFSDHEEGNAWWIRPKTEWSTIAKEKEVYVIANTDQLTDLRDAFVPQTLRELYSAGDKVLVTNAVKSDTK